MQVQIIELEPKGNPGNIKWDMCTATCSGPANYPVIDLPKDSGGHTIIFNINPGSTGLTFAGPKAEDAIWIQPNTKATTKTFEPAKQLGKPQMLKSKLTLILNDQNKDDPVDLHYRLNFSDGSIIDPVIKNGGGTNVPFDPSVAAAWLIGGVILGALVYAGLRKYFSK